MAGGGSRPTLPPSGPKAVYGAGLSAVSGRERCGSPQSPRQDALWPPHWRCASALDWGLAAVAPWQRRVGLLDEFLTRARCFSVSESRILLLPNPGVLSSFLAVGTRPANLIIRHQSVHSYSLQHQLPAIDIDSFNPILAHHPPSLQNSVKVPPRPPPIFVSRPLTSFFRAHGLLQRNRRLRSSDDTASRPAIAFSTRWPSRCFFCFQALGSGFGPSVAKEIQSAHSSVQSYPILIILVLPTHPILYSYPRANPLLLLFPYPSSVP